MAADPTYQDQFQKGQALFEAGDFKGAARLFIPLLETSPEDLDLRQYLTRAYAAFGYFAEAVETFRPNFEKMPEAPEKYGYFGNLCFLAGLAEEALGHLGKAHQMSPGNAELPSAMALCHVQLGDFDQANARIREALTIDPGHIRSLVILADIDAGAPSAENIARLRQVADDQAQHPGNRIDVAFALGKAHLKAREYDQAFASFQAGNELLAAHFKSQGIVYEPKAGEQLFQEIKSFYTREMLGRITPGSAGPRTPVFIIGLPRSGTTLVEQILASHSAVHGAGEYKSLGEFFLQLAQLAAENPQTPKEVILNQVKEAWGREYFQKMNLPQERRVTHTTDKMPLNFPYAGLAYAIFPNARFILLRRHPLDTCLSMYFQPLTESYPASTSLADLGGYYRLFERYLNYWAGVFPENVLEISYEELVADQERVSKKLVAFAGLEWDEACLEYYKNPRSVQTMSNIQVRKPITAENIGRWKHFDRHLKPLKDALGSTNPVQTLNE